MNKAKGWYTVYLYNVDVFGQERFDTVEHAKQYGEKKGFEFYVVQRINGEWVKV